MKIEIKVPEVGEAVKEALLVQWYRHEGDWVKRDELLFLIETDKVTLEVASEADGRLHILVGAGETVPIGAVVATVEAAEAPAKPVQPSPESGAPSHPVQAPPSPAAEAIVPEASPTREPLPPSPGLSPSVRQLVERHGLEPSRITGTGPAGSITKGDVMLHLEAGDPFSASKSATAGPPAPEQEAPSSVTRAVASPGEPAPEKKPPPGAEPPITRKPMSRIRLRIAERLLESRRNTAMLTTFNEIDMSRVQELRSLFKEPFKKKHGVGLGMMSFFIKASIEALMAYPEVNAFIEGNEIVYHHYYHVGVAVGAERGLVVPVIRHADRLSFAELERAIVDYVTKVRENRLEISDMEDGTFTISNGGVYGSLLSTPILNTPQSGILGMHKIEDRPVVVDGAIVIRPMMYVALSYDHRIIDGREAVGFLKHIKECVEQPERILIGV